MGHTLREITCEMMGVRGAHRRLLADEIDEVLPMVYFVVEVLVADGKVHKFESDSQVYYAVIASSASTPASR